MTFRNPLQLRTTVALGLSLLIVPAQAQTYRYSGQCGTQGSWTAAALARTADLKTYIEKVKDDPNCKVLPAKLQASFSAIHENLKQAQSTSSDGPVTDAYQEIQSLAAAASDKPLAEMFQGTAAARMNQKLVQAAVLENSTVTSKIKAGSERKSRMAFLKENAASFGAGLSLVGQVVDSLPAAQRCLDDSTNFGHYFAATIQLVGSFASSGMDQYGSGVARLVSKLAEYSRDEKYVGALRALDQNEYLAALACLLESTSEAYCDARDAQILFQEMTKNSEVVTNSKGELSLKNKKVDMIGNGILHPLQGYYILTQNVPLITSWLQTIQLGVEPRLPTDSSQKNKPILEISIFDQSVNNIRGDYNVAIENIKATTNLDEKKKMTLDMVMKLSNSLTMGGGEQNFFTLAIPAVHMPFKLLGMETPSVVLGGPGIIPMSANGFFDSNGSALSELNDTNAMIAKIKVNLDGIIRRAQTSAIAYYSKWFIVDKVSIVNRSMIGNLSNVKSSLKEIDGYLAKLEQKIKNHSKDKSMILGVRDTRQRISSVLVKFKKIEELGESLKNANLTESSEEVVQATEDLIKEVFDQFSVMLAKSGWLASRMSDFVEYEYDLSQKSGVDMSAHASEIYLETGRAMMEKIIAMSNGNPTSVSSDLAMSLRLNKGNLEAIEKALGPAYLDQIAFLRHIVDGKTKVTEDSMWRMKKGGAYDLDPVPGDNRNPLWKFFISSWKEFFEDPVMLNTAYHKMVSWTKSQNISPDDEFGSARKVMNQFCTQTLAFGNLTPFWHLCKGTAMESPFLTYGGKEISTQAKNALNVIYKDKAWESYKVDRRLNHSVRICALRDFSRKNFVLYLLQGDTNDKQMAN